MSEDKTSAKKAQGANAEQNAEPKLTGIMISKETFASTYAVLHGECEKRVSVASVSRAIPVTNGEGDQVFSNSGDGRPLMKHIINTKAIDGKKVDQVRDLFKGREEIDLGELRGLTLSFNAIIPASGHVNLPFNGQKIVAVTGLYGSRDDKDIKVLGIAAIQVPEVELATNFTFEDVEIEMPEEA